jgi:hypothetical protein
MKNFVQSGEWALTMIAPTGGVATGAIAKVDPATGIVGAAGTKSIGWIVAAAGAGSTTARVRLVPGSLRVCSAASLYARTPNFTRLSEGGSVGAGQLSLQVLRPIA